MNMLLPMWLCWFWVAVYATNLILHMRHSALLRGHHRMWHGGHCVMALGMIHMFMPEPINILSDGLWEEIFRILAVVILIWLAYRWLRRQPVRLIWILSLIHMLAMSYMFVLAHMRGCFFATALTAGFIIYFAGEAAAWFSGALDGVAGNGPRRLSHAFEPRETMSWLCVSALAGTNRLELRITLGTMAAGMAYMFLAMTIG